MAKDSNPIGDYNSFLKAVGKSIVVLLCVGYVGSTVLTVTDMTGHEINELFPVDLNDLPYANTAHSAAAKNLDDLFQEKGAEAVTKDALEFLYPMKRLGFPYKSWFLPEGGECKDIATVVAKWYALTCAGTFSSYRGLCQTLIVLGKWLVNAFENTGDLFLFYIYPYILFYIIFLPIIPVIGYFLAMYSSIVGNIPKGFMLSFAPIMGIVAAVANLFAGSIFNPYSWALSTMISMAGFALGFTNFAWWVILGIALWVYAIVFMFIVPLLLDKDAKNGKSGLERVFHKFADHKKSMLFIALLIILKSSLDFLTPAVSAGIAAVAAYYLFKTFFG
jgi:hypothetical protein